MYSESSCCFQGQKVHQDNKDLLELQDILDIPVVQVYKVVLDSREHVDQRDQRALQEGVILDHPGL